MWLLQVLSRYEVLITSGQVRSYSWISVHLQSLHNPPYLAMNMFNFSRCNPPLDSVQTVKQDPHSIQLAFLNLSVLRVSVQRV